MPLLVYNANHLTTNIMAYAILLVPTPHPFLIKIPTLVVDVISHVWHAKAPLKIVLLVIAILTYIRAVA